MMLVTELFPFNFCILKFGKMHFRRRESPIGGFREKRRFPVTCRLSIAHFNSVHKEYGAIGRKIIHCRIGVLHNVVLPVTGNHTF